MLSLLFKRIFPKATARTQLIASLRLFVALGLIYLSIILLKIHIIWVMFLLFPLLFLYAFTTYQESGNLVQQFQQSLSLLNKSYGKGIGLFFSISLVALLLFLALDTMIFSVFFELLAWIFPFEQEQLDLVSTISLTFITVFVLFFVFCIYFLAFSVLYHAALEARDAPSLKAKIEKIGQTQRIRGMERE